MPANPRDRSPFSYIEWIKKRLFGETKTKPCAQFSTFDDLLQAVGSSGREQYNAAFECLYDRYLPVASREAKRFKHRDEGKAVEALDDVFITIQQRIKSGQLRLVSELHMRHYVTVGIRNQLLKGTIRDGRLPIVQADDLTLLLETSGVSVESELNHMLVNEAVEQAFTQLTEKCQEKLLMVQTGYSNAEIMAKLTITMQAVKTGIFRCRTELAALLAKMAIYVRLRRTDPGPADAFNNA